jgi:hypothetical protein
VEQGRTHGTEVMLTGSGSRLRDSMSLVRRGSSCPKLYEREAPLLHRAGQAAEAVTSGNSCRLVALVVGRAFAVRLDRLAALGQHVGSLLWQGNPRLLHALARVRLTFSKYDSRAESLRNQCRALIER